MHIIVGLGNPGVEYKNTRHNVGFLAIDYLHDYYNFSSYNQKFKCDFALGEIEKYKVLLAKPKTYMNLSGEAVSLLKNFYKPTSILVMHDDLDTNFCDTKIKYGGSSGGHNGLKSITNFIGSNYARIKIGIGRPHDENITDFVLGKFSAMEKKELENTLQNLMHKFPSILNEVENHRF